MFGCPGSNQTLYLTSLAWQEVESLKVLQHTSMGNTEEVKELASNVGIYLRIRPVSTPTSSLAVNEQDGSAVFTIPKKLLEGESSCHQVQLDEVHLLKGLSKATLAGL